MQKMNELHKKLQGNEVFAHDLHLKFKSLQTKLTVLQNECQMKTLRTFLS